LILRPLSNAAISVAKPPQTQSNSELPHRRYGPLAALIILAVASGIVLVLVVEWLGGLLN
jgi:hypothetical protein